MKKLFRYMKPYLGRMSVGLIIKIAGTLAELALPYILSLILDEVIPAAAAEGDRGAGIRRILLWGGLMVLCAAAALVFNVVANRMASLVARDTARLIRHDLFDSTLRLSCAQADAFTVPSLESRLTTDTYNVHHMVGMMQRIGVRAPILLLGGLTITLFLDPVLTLVMLGVLPLIALVVYLVSKRGVTLFRNSQLSGDAMIRVVREDVQGIRVIKALSRKEYEKDRYAAVNDQLVHDEFRASVTMAISNPVINLFLNLGLVAVLIVGAIRVNNGVCLPGKIIAFIQYFTLLSNALLSITRIFMMMTKGTASMNRINEVVEAAAEHRAQPLGQHLSRPANPDSYLEFDHVRFSYRGKTDNLHDIDFRLPCGGTLGVIGATGSGKSTLLALLLRFYQVAEGCGAVRLGGKDIRDMTAEELRRRFGVAMQNDFLFAGTIGENIRFDRDLSREQIEKAARAAQAWEFISALPEGLDYKLTSKGTNLSGGQKQRLLIARALAGDPDVLILDDASSALDYRTDAQLRQALRADAAERAKEGGLDPVTTIVIAQRVSSIKHADLILVLDKGEVIGAGTHEELTESCPVYSEIAQSQMGGAILD
ncbi:MAG: ABC transporter ATP-binding protein/permease [Clostridia bacterium]|nr:ABC transporter ATP-binding protein/permease [Clostridia bacterium]